ncbi:MAG TPA: rRNA maturation RNase YbeY [Methylococcaceae bacterium]|jgi:probable rRNA maturation factor|nr:rRNA maturation RNase YbeY [Methylococcaceae bacterium]HIN69112.1 rRNA maturation RNase YbeY [Methylococcales bacterium]HIA46067.1 rRNA maturation RNase YbeY [Methylococcaceae bacterium]HIB62159.1 rRNA maturation RNase YbeY [Methylococcaceae bacterium]HIO12617.1 rRNA maturation RNase YbeY [Methylococcales bacterium]
MVELELQRVCHVDNEPSLNQFELWVETVLADQLRDIELVIRIVDEPESTALNEQYRHKSGPTNILSFPVELPVGIEIPLLGDLVICAPVVVREANEQKKLASDHWAHLVIHGVLHLLGFDHIEDQQAELMEAKEIAVLKKLSINNPYIEAVNS